MKNILIIAALLLTVACGSTNSQEAEKVEYNITLSDGNKWIVNEEMKPHIEKGEYFINDYIENKKTDHVELAKNMKEANNHLISSCTMEGESHDELHKWLEVHIKFLNQLKSAKTEAEINKAVANLKASFEAYHTYFQ